MQMSNKPKIHSYKTLIGLAKRIRDDLKQPNQDIVLIFGYNGTGKTRLSGEFKNLEKKKADGKQDTLYFNAFTEDLFYWDNDLDKDAERYLHINSKSKFFSGLKELALEDKIGTFLNRYTDFNFKIDYEQWRVVFSRDREQNIKISRGEENMFIWCFFLAVCELALGDHDSYKWVKYIYIDDPISSLDDNNAIAVACDLARLLTQKEGEDGKLTKREKMPKVVISTHHGLFFNIMWNEFKNLKVGKKVYFYHRGEDSGAYILRSADETPFFYHVAMLSQIKTALKSGKIYTYHFNVMRSILEKTAVFFGFSDFSTCLEGVKDEALHKRAVNLLSHGKYSFHEPQEMNDDNKRLFKSIFNAFMEKYKFDLPEMAPQEKKTS